MEKGKINEGEYLAQCKYLKEEKELEELAKEITTFDIESSPQEGDFIPMAFEVPEEILAMGVEAVQIYSRNLQQEASLMSGFSRTVQPMITDEGELRIYRRDTASEVLRITCKSMRELIEQAHGLEPSFTDGEDTDEFWSQWLEDIFTRCIERSGPTFQEQVRNAGFSTTLNDDINFRFSFHREPRILKFKVYACIFDNIINNIQIGVMMWQLGGDFEWGGMTYQ
jgi:hypothetical protein